MGRKRSEVIFRTPTPEPKKPVIESIVIPLLIALVSGGLVAGFVVLLVQEILQVWWTWSRALLLWASFTLVVWALSTWRDLLWFLEKTTGKDIDKDGAVGRPGEDRLILMRPRNQEDSAARDRRKRLDFEEFVRGCEVDTSLRRWERLIGREKYAHYRDSLIDCQWASWLDPDNTRRGWQLDAKAEEIITSLD